MDITPRSWITSIARSLVRIGGVLTPEPKHSILAERVNNLHVVPRNKGRSDEPGRSFLLLEALIDVYLRGGLEATWSHVGGVSRDGRELGEFGELLLFAGAVASEPECVVCAAGSLQNKVRYSQSRS